MARTRPQPSREPSIPATARPAYDAIVGLTDAWEPDAFEMVDVIDAGDDRLVTRYTRPVRGKASGVEDVLDYWCVNTVRRGQVLRYEWYASRAKALDAVGLSE